MQKLRPRLTYANVIATLALFLALGGGAAYAASNLGRNSVGSKQLKAGAVTGAKVKDGSLSATDFASGQVPRGERGPAGDRGAQGERGVPGAAGAAGATDVVVRYAEEEGKPKDENEIGLSYAACAPGETVTGGGFDFLNEPELGSSDYSILANRPSAAGTEIEGELVYPETGDGSPADGWLAMIRNDADPTIFFQAYVLCARP
jgi:hypothetical protein